MDPGDRHARLDRPQDAGAGARGLPAEPSRPFPRSAQRPARAAQLEGLAGLRRGLIASPIDLVPEFIPVLGPLDDAVVAALVLRHVLRRTERGHRTTLAWQPRLSRPVLPKR